MNILVTGGLGFIGSNLCDDLCEFYNVFCIDNLSTGYEENKNTKVTYFKEDLLNIEKLKYIFNEHKFDIVFHLAALPRVSFSIKEPNLTFHNNVVACLNILECIRLFSPNTKLINSSSSSVYGGADQLPTPESYPLNPKSFYAMQKMHTEQLCKLYSVFYNINTCSLRYFNVFGPRSRFGGAYSTVMSAWMYAICSNDKKYIPFLEGDGTVTRDFCFVENVVQANKLVGLSDKNLNGECYNVAQGFSTSLIEIKNMIEIISGTKLHLESRNPRIGDVQHTLADISKIKTEFGYAPSTDLKSQIIVMFDWYLKNIQK